MRSIKPHLQAAREPEKAEPESGWQHPSGGPSVRLTAVLCKATIERDDLLDLKVGDIIHFDHKVEEPVLVRVSNQEWFWGYPVRVGQKLGVKLAGTLEGDA